MSVAPQDGGEGSKLSKNSPAADLNSTENARVKPAVLSWRKGTNYYAAKKTFAQGLLDIALLSANASQLRTMLIIGPREETDDQWMK